MSLKAIELQIAIPKTVEAGKVAEQKQQQSQLSQDNANILTERQAIKNKETVLEAKKYAKTNKDNNNEQNAAHNGERNITEEEEKSNHPYKGSFVDFSG